MASDPALSDLERSLVKSLDRIGDILGKRDDTSGKVARLERLIAGLSAQGKSVLERERALERRLEALEEWLGPANAHLRPVGAMNKRLPLCPVCESPVLPTFAGGKLSIWCETGGCWWWWDAHQHFAQHFAQQEAE